MNDGSMFTGLMKYRNKSFWEGHKTITFDTLTDRHQYEEMCIRDSSQRANGFLTLAGGVIITFAKEILTLITG